MNIYGTKTFYQCGCNQMYYYPCDYLQSKYMEGYCCDPICYKNQSLNSVNFITCGYNVIFTSIIKNLENITNTFVRECRFDDQSCQNYWENLKKNPFECFYAKSNPNQILLSKPDFLTLPCIFKVKGRITALNLDITLAYWFYIFICHIWFRCNLLIKIIIK